MGNGLRSIIKNYPFAFFFFLGGGLLGVLVAEQLHLASIFYSQIKNPFEYDLTGGLLNDLIFNYPITIFIDFLIGSITGLLFSIFGLIIDIKKKEKNKASQKKYFESSRKEVNNSSIEEIEKERLKLDQERLALEKERLELAKEKQNL